MDFYQADWLEWTKELAFFRWLDAAFFFFFDRSLHEEINSAIPMGSEVWELPGMDNPLNLYSTNNSSLRMFMNRSPWSAWPSQINIYLSPFYLNPHISSSLGLLNSVSLACLYDFCPFLLSCLKVQTRQRWDWWGGLAQKRAYRHCRGPWVSSQHLQRDSELLILIVTDNPMPSGLWEHLHHAMYMNACGHTHQK